MVEVRHFGYADSCDILHLCNWYRIVTGIPAVPGRVHAFLGRSAIVDGKALQRKAFIELVDKERKARGMEPIRRERC